MTARQIPRAIRSCTPLPLRKAIRRLGEYFGYGLRDRFPHVESSLALLQRLGFAPAFCVDVGAYKGEWTAMFRSIYPRSKVLMIEAQEGRRAILETLTTAHPGEITLTSALLGPSDGDSVEFSEMASGSSVFAETSGVPRTVVKKTTRRLDSLLKEGNHPRADFLKLDVQGYELQVLAGAAETLAQTTAVLMETSLVPINTGCPLIAEVIAFMDRAGFRLFDFCSQIRRGDNVLWQTDLLFLRKDSPLVPAASL